MLVRAILPDWAQAEHPERPKVKEGDFSEEQILDLMEQSYNLYWLPNHPGAYNPKATVDGTHIDVFDYVFVDMDMKEGKWDSKKRFVDVLLFQPLPPSFITDSGNGIHAYWRVSDLDANSYLRLQRRLCRRFNTDEAVSKIFQLMRLVDSINFKSKDEPKSCTKLHESEATYTCEDLDKWLPPITKEDEAYCSRHYDQTYKVSKEHESIDDSLPPKFQKLVKDNKEVKELYAGNVDDRSKADYRLAHIMYAEGFSKKEAMSVLVNCRKAIDRAPIHRFNYACTIADKVWGFEATGEVGALSNSVRDILKRGSAAQGTRFKCWEVYDGTHHGFRLTEVLGLIGGAGSGKTTLALNYFYWFTRLNPDYCHLFVSLEQPEEEIAQRWARMVGDNDRLHDRVHVLGNYNPDGTYRNLSLSEIETYVLSLEQRLGQKVGCIVIDHIGVLKKQGKDGEAQGLIDICHGMKAFAKRTRTFLVMQSQTSRDKAGNGDLELNKDAAYGTSIFEWYVDQLVTTWQPLKRIYPQMPEMTCSAFKYCKIRNKNVKLDRTKEDVVHVLKFDPDTELLRQMTQEEEASYNHWNSIATKIRNKDRKSDPTKITKIDWVGKEAS